MKSQLACLKTIRPLELDGDQVKRADAAPRQVGPLIQESIGSFGDHRAPGASKHP